MKQGRNEAKTEDAVSRPLRRKLRESGTVQNTPQGNPAQGVWEPGLYPPAPGGHKWRLFTGPAGMAEQVPVAEKALGQREQAALGSMYVEMVGSEGHGQSTGCVCLPAQAPAWTPAITYLDKYSSPLTGLLS